MMLQRSSGNGLRKWTNKNEVEKALFDTLGVSEIATVYVDEKTPPLEQVRVFCSYHIILTSHSSQLANLVFAVPGSSTIEFQGVQAKSEPTFEVLGGKVGLHYQR